MVDKGKPRFFYGWLIVGILIISMMLTFATRSSFNVFYVAILDEYGWTHADTAGIFSINLIVYGFGGILAGILMDKLGPRKLFPMAATLIALGAVWCSQATRIWEFYVAFGLIMAFGQCALGYVPTVTLVNRWFVKRRGLAAGIAMFGFSLSFLLSPVTQYLRETVGWRAAFLVFAAAVFFIVAPLTGIFTRHRPQDKGLLPDGAKQPTESELETRKSYDASIVDHKWVSVEWTLPRALKTYRLWLLWVAAMMNGILFNFPQVHQVAFITDVGYSAMFAVAMFSILGLLNGIGPFGGFLSDRIGRETCFTLGVSSVAIGILVAFFIRGPGLEWAWYISAACYGLGLGLSQPMLPAIYGDLFAGRNLGSIIGFANAGFGVGGALGPYLAGYIYDVTGSYTLSFLLVLAAAPILIAMAWLVAPRKVRLVAGRISKRPVVTGL
ncbi:MFS transporter [Chloroflexota bacterium]